MQEQRRILQEKIESCENEKISQSLRSAIETEREKRKVLTDETVGRLKMLEQLGEEQNKIESELMRQLGARANAKAQIGSSSDETELKIVTTEFNIESLKEQYSMLLSSVNDVEMGL